MRAGRSARTAVIAALGLLVMTTSGGAIAAVEGDGAGAVFASYDKKIPQLMAQQDVPGLAVALVDGDRVVWQRAFGSTDTGGGGRPVTADTMFSVQSTSKVFTATAVMRAVQAGRLELDVPITTYLPTFRVNSVFEPHPERLITLRTLLAHTAGFTHEAPVGNNDDPEPGEFDAHVASISETWLRFPVGSGYAYSNLGIDLAGYILEQVYDKPFPTVMHDLLLAPLGMTHSTFDRYRIDATTARAVAHSGDMVTPPVHIGMMAAGGLWSSAADLARFLRFQLGDGVVGGRTVLEPALMREMRTVPAPDAGAQAGYALGVARTHWRAGQNLDLFGHGGGGFGFLTDLTWLPQLQLGIAVVTNSDTHDLQNNLALGILRDLVTSPTSSYHDRMLALPTQANLVDPDGKFIPPTYLAERIDAVALPASGQQAERWAGYGEWYRSGRLGAMDPSDPVARFHVNGGVPYFDATEEGTAVRHQLTEVRPGLFLAENGETLDLRRPSPRWRGMYLTPVTNGPLPAQWALLVSVALVTAGWLLVRSVGWLRRRRLPSASSSPGIQRDRTRRRLTVALSVVATLAALAALTTVAAIVALPALVDVGFLGWFALPLPVRLAFHLPLAVVVLAAAVGALVLAGVLRRWWSPRFRPGDGVLALALIGFSLQLASWQVVGWGF